MEISTISTQLSAVPGNGGTFLELEGSVRLSLPLLMYAQSRINREELKPLTLEAVLVGHNSSGSKGFFYSCDPVVLWRSSLSTGLDVAREEFGSRKGRETVWSFVSDVSTGSRDHSLDDDFNENDRIFDTALRQGASFMQFPFRFRIPNSLPPSILQPDNAATFPNEGTCIACTAQLEALTQDPAGLVRHPQYEVMAMLSFESFAVSAYQVVTAPIELTRGLRMEGLIEGETVEAEGVLAGGSFRYMIWDAPRYHVLKSAKAYEFKLQFTGGTLDLKHISSISIRPVYRYKHMSAPDHPQNNHSHLYTPYQSSTPDLPAKTLQIPPSATHTATFNVSLNLSALPYPTAQNLGTWGLENAVEVAVVYHKESSAQGSLGRIIKPQTHAHHLHHADGAWVPHADGSRAAFCSVPVEVVHPYLAPRATAAVNFAVSAAGEMLDEREELERLMDRVEEFGVTVEGTVSCLFSAKKLTRIGLKEWVDAGTDVEASVTGRKVDDFELANDGGNVAMYRSDAKNQAGSTGKKKELALDAPVPPLPPIPSGAFPATASPQALSPPVNAGLSTPSPSAPIAASPVSPYIPKRSISAVAVPVELSSPQTPATPSPSIPPRNDSNDIREILRSQHRDEAALRRQSIAISLNLVEVATNGIYTPDTSPFANPGKPLIIPTRVNSQLEKPRRIFVQPMARGLGDARRPLPSRPAIPKPTKPLPTIPLPSPPTQQPQHVPPRSASPSGSIGSLTRPPARPSAPQPPQSATSANPRGTPTGGDDAWEEEDDEALPLDENGNEIGVRKVTFAEHVQKFSALSYQFSDAGTEDSSAVGSMHVLDSMIPKRMSLGTQMEHEILQGTFGDEEGGVDVDEAGQGGSMIPRGREVIASPFEPESVGEDKRQPTRVASLVRPSATGSAFPTPAGNWRSAGVGAGAAGVAVYGSLPRDGMLARSGSQDRSMDQFRQEFTRSGSLGGSSAPHGLGASRQTATAGGNGPNEDPWSKSGPGSGFLTRMVGSVGSLGRSVGRVAGTRSDDSLGRALPTVPATNSPPQQHRLNNAGSALSPPLPPTPVQKGASGAAPVIAPRTSSARWTEDDDK
ncbi:hypothetical protein BC830DRAFT_1153955 [Chytriomyces sp. MP71]|nr:hypothetical protein BC830DRAFT_1153955 [Chytriomyces sp. MP71]